MRQIKMMRRYAGQVHAFKHALMNGRLGMGSNFVEDRGACAPASRSSGSSYYHFEDTAMGARPLVLIGTLPEIDDFFRRESRYGIVNSIPDLPAIHVKAARYRPGERFKELAAGHGMAKALIDTFKTGVGIMADGVVDRAVAGVMPRHNLGQVAGGDVTLASIVKGVADLTMATDNTVQAWKGTYTAAAAAQEGPEFYIEFTYMKSSGARCVGTRRLDFSERNLFWSLAEALCVA